MTIDIKKDLEIIEAATDGPWHGTLEGIEDSNCIYLSDPIYCQQDVNYIARFNPSHCKELVTALKESEADRELMLEFLQHLQGRALLTEPDEVALEELLER